VDYLRSYGEELGLTQILGAFLDREDVQGAVLTFDEWWLAAWQWQATGRSEDWERSWRYFPHSPMSFPPFLPVDAHMQNDTRWIPNGQPDLNWRPPFWSDYSAMHDSRRRARAEGARHRRSDRREVDLPPIRLVIAVLPPVSGENSRGFDLPQTRLPIRIEVRPPARLANVHQTAARPLVGGVSVGSGQKIYGTLGGVVADAGNRRFGSTCAHVFPTTLQVEQPALRDDSRAKRIGKSEPISLQHCTSPTPCGPYVKSPHITATDSALIQLNSGISADLEVVSVGPLAGLVPKNSMTPGQTAEFVGRTSGHRIAEIGGLALFYRLRMANAVYCFRDLFEIRWNSFARTIFGPVVQAGDSGSWVVSPTASGMGWCGQIVGEDRHIGYAAFAENVVDEWSKRGRFLRVV
jgi:hypothetical protein